MRLPDEESRALLMLVAFLFIMINLAVDIAYAMLDPRIRRSGR